MAIEVRIIPTRTLFYSEDNSFGIYGCNINPQDEGKVKLNQYSNISIKGVAPKLSHNEEYIAILNEDTGSKYAGSYILESIRQEKPTTILEQRKFFEMILTANQVESIFNAYEGQDIIKMIQEDTFDHTNIKGIGDKTYEKMREKVLNNLDMGELLVFLNNHGIKFNMISKLLKEFKNPQIVMEKIEENPYMLTKVKGIGFRTADAIAKAMGYDMKSPNRINSCLTYIISQENSNGHSWIGFRGLLNGAIELLEIDKATIEEAIRSNPKGIISLDEKYTTEKVYEAEKDVSLRMTQFKTQSTKLFTTEEIDEFLNEYCEKRNLELEENQRQFFHDWNENNILMLVGGGGMGKSWLQRILLELISKKNYTTALLAPTGKASKVMSNYTGRQASTIHRKAGVYDSEEEGTAVITEDAIIVDESSMCDVFILQKLFTAIVNNNARVLFVGDDFQLPSVGVGNFLYDIINSNRIKVSKLKKVFRQADGGILNVATDVREGNRFLNDTDEGRMVFGKDCVFWLTDSAYIRDGVISNYKKVIQRYNQEDVVILTPTNKGKLGTVELNKEIQKIANPKSAEKKEKVVGHKDFPTIFRVGDAVMNIVNTYDIETVDGGVADIFNGDTGKILDINEEEKVFIVEIDGIAVKMKFGTILTNLVHSWVTTIHKSQGSQYKVVILIVDKSMTFQLNANLLYTGLSRAQEYMLVLAQARTINQAMKKFANMERRSFMQDMLNAYNGTISGEIEKYNNISELS